jgi:hypothetical protein
MVTIAPDFGQQPIDRPSVPNVKRVWLKLARVLRIHGIRLAFGGIDFSVNMDKDGRKPYLQVHFTLFIPQDKWPQSDKKLRQAINPSGDVDQAVYVQLFDGNNAGLAYALKNEFSRRFGFQQCPEDRRDERATRQTRNRPLRGPDWARLMVLLDRIGLDTRLSLLGVKRIRKSGRIIMKLLE